MNRIIRRIDFHKMGHLVPAFVFMLIVGSVGVHEIFFSHAEAIYYTSSQASSGSLGGGASVITDASASEGKSVQFITASGGSSGGGGGSSTPSYSVVGNSIENSSGQKIFLHGVDRPSLEWSCSGTTVTGAGTGIPASDFATMKNNWNANAVRLPVSEDRWLSNTADSCSTYQATVKAAVANIEANGMIAIVDLHWSDQGSDSIQSGQQCMPDQNSVTFWQQIATLYKGDPNVWFELYNEPYPPGSTQAAQWNIWQNGGSVTCNALVGGHTATWTAPGMQSLVNTVRATGANNIVIAGGLAYSSVLANAPALTGGNVAYAVHPYDNTSDPDGATDGSWANNFGNQAAKAPVIATEFGDQQCGDPTYENAILSYFHAHNMGYTAWAWYVGGCSFPSVITDAAGDCVNSMGCAIQTDMKNQ